MKILIVGGTGLLGGSLADFFKERHDVIVASRHHGDVIVDVEDYLSVTKMFETIGSIDAVLSAVGAVEFLPLLEMKPENYQLGLKNKLMGQVNLVLAGIPYLNDKGSFTLTSGILSEDPIPAGTSAAMVNGAIDAFVRAASIELTRQLRINAVNPTVFVEALDHYGDFFPGFEAVPVQKVVLAFQKSVEGAQTGKIYKVW